MEGCFCVNRDNVENMRAHIHSPWFCFLYSFRFDFFPSHSFLSLLLLLFISVKLGCRQRTNKTKNRHWKHILLSLHGNFVFKYPSVCVGTFTMSPRRTYTRKTFRTDVSFGGGLFIAQFESNPFFLSLSLYIFFFYFLSSSLLRRLFVWNVLRIM